MSGILCLTFPKSKQHLLKDMFNDTIRYLDDIFTIDNPEFEKHIPDNYPTDLQLNKANGLFPFRLNCEFHVR